jgi:hypothetical protein
MAYPILHYLITRIVFDEEQTLLSYLHQFRLTLSILGLSILLSILFSSNLSMYSSLNVKDQVSHPYKTISKIIIL